MSLTTDRELKWLKRVVVTIVLVWLVFAIGSTVSRYVECERSGGVMYRSLCLDPAVVK